MKQIAIKSNFWELRYHNCEKISWIFLKQWQNMKNERILVFAEYCIYHTCRKTNFQYGRKNQKILQQIAERSNN